MLEGVLREIYYEEVVPSEGGIPEQLYEATRDIFERATAQGMAQSRNKRIVEEEDFLRKYTHSIEVFSAFRAHRYGEMMASKLHDDEGNLLPFEQWRKATASIQSHFNRSWLETEYSTAILRAQQAADWKGFERDKGIAPNLTWMPTSSADPREEHAVFWRDALTLPVSDPFWDEHRPGDLWNCKCWLKQTDAPATPSKEIPKGKGVPKPAKGLETNPGKTAEMFSSKQPHYPNPKTCIWLKLAGGKVKNRMGRFFDAAKCIHDCNLCELITLSKADKNLKLFEKLKIDKNYESVNYDEESGALKATHKRHNTTKKGNKFFKDENDGKGYSGNQLELFCQDALYKAGHSCILLEEKVMSREKGGELTALDALIDGVRMDIKSITENSENYRNRLTKKNKQLIRWNAENPTDKSHAVCLYFHRAEFFSEARMEFTIDKTKKIFEEEGNQQLRVVYCVVKGDKRMYKYTL